MQIAHSAIKLKTSSMQFKFSQSANIFFDGVKFYLTNSLTEIIYSIPVM